MIRLQSECYCWTSWVWRASPIELRAQMVQYCVVSGMSEENDYGNFLDVNNFLHRSVYTTLIVQKGRGGVGEDVDNMRDAVQVCINDRQL